jgi:mannose-6-phosphate isomerase-like protein (cupin superfamily)
MPFNLSPLLQGTAHKRGLIFGAIILLALMAFEVFNYSSTFFALRDILGDLSFGSLRWATLLALAFCGIDFAGIARIFTPEKGRDEPAEVWYLFAAWFLAAAFNASLTWWGVSVAMLQHTAQRIANGAGIWGTGFAFDRVIDDAAYRPHSMSIVFREGYTQPEIHQLKWDIYVVLEGSGTVLMGGLRTNWRSDLPAERQRPELEGAEAFRVVAGDMVHIPARVWHQLVLEEGESMLYALININEPAPTP